MKISVLGQISLAIAFLTACSGRNNSSSSEVSEDCGNVVYNNILSRTSVRAYTDESISSDVVGKLLRAGMAAPTARDSRPWYFVVVNKKETMSALAETGAKMAAEAPLAIVVCGDTSRMLKGNGRQEYWIQDCSAATENILLAAHGFGLGAVWTGGYPNVERAVKVAGVLNISKQYIPLCMIIIGHPAEKSAAKDKWNKENVSLDYYDGAIE